MKTRIKLAWKILRGKSQSWVFFNLTKKQQEDLINGKGADITLCYVNTDSRAVDKLKNKMIEKK